MTITWERKPLGEILEVRSGQVDPRVAPYRNMPHVGGDNIESHSGRLSGITTAADLGLKSGKYPFDERDVLYSKIRPNLNKVVAPDIAGICSADIYPLRPAEGLLSREFLVYLLRSNGFLAYAEKQSTRTNIPKINREALLAYRAPLPSLPEQHRIAAILDKADAIRRKRQEAIQLTEQFLRSAFLDMFGDPVTNRRGWRVDSLRNLVRRDDKINYGVVQPGTEYPGGVPIVRVGDLPHLHVSINGLKRIDPDIESKYKRSRLQGDEVLVACVGSIGIVALADDRLKDFNTVRAVARIRCGPEVNRYFLASYLSTPGIQAYFTKVTRTVSQPTLNIKQIEQTQVLVPPLTRQEQFAAIVVKHIAASDKFASTARTMGDLSKSLVQRAFRGKL